MGKEWFEEVFGFREVSYAKTQGAFTMEGETLVCPTSKYPPQFVGPFETVSVAELRSRCEQAVIPEATEGLRFSHLATPVGVQPLIADSANAGAVFQAASQFNALEMVGPGVSPRQGVSSYALDPTQGPKCALACPAATVYRNYLCQGGAGQGSSQIDCLAGVGAVVGNEKHQYWEMRNGYALPIDTQAMRKLGARLKQEPGLAERAVAELRIAVHWDTEVKPPLVHRVAQVFASALPVAYSKSTASTDWEPFARLVLRGAYEATLAVGRCLATSRGCRVKVFLTALGGGAFGNRHAWIVDAIAAALYTHRDAPLDVVLVHYGTRPPKDWVNSLALAQWRPV